MRGEPVLMGQDSARGLIEALSERFQSQPPSYMEKRMEAYVKRHKQDLKALRCAWRSLEWRRPALSAAEADALTPL